MFLVITTDKNSLDSKLKWKGWVEVSPPSGWIFCFWSTFWGKFIIYSSLPLSSSYSDVASSNLIIFSLGYSWMISSLFLFIVSKKNLVALDHVYSTFHFLYDMLLSWIWRYMLQVFIPYQLQANVLPCWETEWFL